MNVLIGLEAGGNGTPPVLSLLDRLRFAGESRTAICAVSPTASEGWQLAPLLGDVEAERRERVATAQAEKRLDTIALNAVHRVVVGRPSQVLLAEAEKSFDLVAVNASNRSGLESVFTGSVARALVVGATQSVLLARPSEKSGPLHVVFATDHSDYAERCLETLAAHHPEGIGRLTVLTACPNRLTDRFYDLAAEMLEAANDVVFQSAAARGIQTIEKLSGRVGTPQTTFESVVLPGEPRDVLTGYMQSSGADLLILGAKGHGPIARLALGSVSFDQAIGPHPWSVLILRA